jgi:L-threonylcarbamoyladenylate synthase
MKFQTDIGQDLNKAADLLLNGEVVAIPTETVYGLAGNGLSSDTAVKIYKAKNRPLHNPLILHISEWSKLDNLIDYIPQPLQHLMDHFQSGPLTLLLPKSALIPDIITAGQDRVAIRIPAHPITRLLLQSINIPLAAPSANPFGYISPTTADHVYQQLNGKIPYILDGGPCSLGLESTIIGVEREKIIVYRLGSLDIDQLEAIVGSIELKSQYKKNESVAAPGMLKQHYSPKTRFYYNIEVLDLLDIHAKASIGGLVFQHKNPSLDPNNQLVLSTEGNLDEAAANLYKYMHILDNMNLDAIWAESIPKIGIGKAINDRLERAASQ